MTKYCATKKDIHASLLFSSLLCSSLLCSTLVFTTLLYSALLYSSRLFSSLLYSTLLFTTHSTLLYSSILCSTLLCSSLLFSTCLFSSLLYYSTLLCSYRLFSSLLCSTMPKRSYIGGIATKLLLIYLHEFSTPCVHERTRNKKVIDDTYSHYDIDDMLMLDWREYWTPCRLGQRARMTLPSRPAILAPPRQVTPWGKCCMSRSHCLLNPKGIHCPARRYPQGKESCFEIKSSTGPSLTLCIIAHSGLNGLLVNHVINMLFPSQEHQNCPPNSGRQHGGTVKES